MNRKYREMFSTVLVSLVWREGSPVGRRMREAVRVPVLLHMSHQPAGGRHESGACHAQHIFLVMAAGFVDGAGDLTLATRGSVNIQNF